MTSKFHHEQIYRGADSLARLSAVRLTLCGAGALGSHLADNLVRQGFVALKVPNAASQVVGGAVSSG